MECRLRVGLLDVDVYGPSIPSLMKLQGCPQLDSGLLLPTFEHLDQFVLRLPVESVGICLAAANTSLDTQWRDTHTFRGRFQSAEILFAVMRLTHI
jgi:Mrp family chromosome partitioning ATPase